MSTARDTAKSTLNKGPMVRSLDPMPISIHGTSIYERVLLHVILVFVERCVHDACNKCKILYFPSRFPYFCPSKSPSWHASSRIILWSHHGQKIYDARLSAFSKKPFFFFLFFFSFSFYLHTMLDLFEL